MGVQANLNTLIGDIAVEVEKTVDEKLAGFTKTLEAKMEEVDQKIISGVKLTIEYDDKTTEVKGLKHHMFPKLLMTAGQRLPIMLVGQAGTGKTYAGEQIARALGLEFYAISFGSQTSKTDLTGYRDANGNTVRTAFREAFEHGGVFVGDEIDAGNSNVTITLNSALSSDFCPFPDGMVKKHKDFIFIGTANTFGHGASREYVGRNQLDAATLDRFVTIEWVLDERLEQQLVKPYKHGDTWLRVIRGVRDYVERNSLRMMVTPRATIYGSKLLEQDMDANFVIDVTLMGSAPEKSFGDIQRKARALWEERKPKEVSSEDVQQRLG